MSLYKRFCPLVCALLALSPVFLNGAFLHGQISATPSKDTALGSKTVQTVPASFLAAPVFLPELAPSGVIATDLDGDGKPDLIVASATTGKVMVYLGLGKGKFSTAKEYSVGGHPTAIIAADIDGDGIKDVVTANGTDGTVSVLLTTAGGKLASSHVYSVGVDANLLSAGDLNGDGKQDIIVGSESAKALAILLNDGQGTLQKASVQGLGKIPSSFAMGDFNGDGHLDVVVASADGTVDTLSGGGDGTLKLSGSLVASSTALSYVVAGDFNGDGKLDLAVSDLNGHILTAFLGKGDGTFSKGGSYKVGNKPLSIVALDANGDGLTDLISVNQGSNTLSVLLGKGDGSFQSATDFAVGDGPVAITAADFYGAGYAGLAVINTSAKSINVIAGKGDGSFRAAPSYSGDLSPRAIVAGDLNGDGLQDIVVTNFCGSDATCAGAGSLSIYLALKGGGYRLASTQTIGAGPVSVALSDLNGDGILDVVALNRGDKSISVLLGVGDGTLQAPTTSPLVGSPVAVVAKDFDKDGKVDLAVVSDCGKPTCSQRGSVDTYFGNGDGTFRFGSTTPVGFSPTSVTAGDLNGDGTLDLVVANACGKDASCKSAGTATVLLGAAQGVFTPQADINLNNAPSSIALRAMSVSSVLDLVVSHEADNTVAVLPGNGDGTFKSASLYAVGASPRSLVIADVNGDGKPDIAVANVGDSTVSVLYGQVDGSFVAGDSYAVAAGPEALTSVVSTVGTPASLLTANGNSASSSPGSEITLLSNVSPSDGTPTAIALTITPTSGTVNSAFTLQATISPAPPDGETITFSSDDISQFTDCTNPASITSGVASCTTSQLTAGQRTVTASYAGDTNFAATSTNQTQTVNPVAATLSVAGPSTSLTVNQSVTYTATLGAGSGSFSPTAPSGTVSFTITGQTGVTPCANAAVVLANGAYTASCTFTTVAAGSVSVTASYGNDNNFTVSGSASSSSQTVNPVAATLSIAGPSTSPTVNQSVTYTATLGAGSGSFSPTAPVGTVSFTITGQTGVTPCANAPVVLANGAYTASCTFTTVTAGSVSVAATYGSDNNFTVSGSTSSGSQTVNPVAATLSVAGSSTSPTVNQSVTYTATLGAGSGSFSPTAPVGTVSFTISGQTGVTPCANAPVVLANGAYTASCTFTTVAAGSVSVTASYGNDNNFTVAGPASSGSQTVNPVAATLSVAGPSTSPTVNQSVTYTATLGVGSGSFSPTAPAGAVSFTITGQTGVTPCANAPVVLANGAYTASCTFTTVAAGSVSVAASYGSDNNFTVSGSTSSGSLAVTPVAATLALAGPSASPTVNQSITYTATLGAGSGSFSPTAPVGTVSFTISGQTGVTPCANAPVVLANGAYTASCTFTTVAAGSVSVTASYGSDNNFSVSGLASSGSLTVNQLATNLTISPTTASTVNAAVNFIATISAATNGASLSPTAPSGTVAFKANGTVITGCEAIAVANLSATCTTRSLNTFANTIVATYSGDANYIGAPSPTVTQSVNPIAAMTSVNTTPSSAVVNQPVSFAATVQGVNNGPIAPTGTVTFSQAGSPLCSNVSLSASGSSTLATATATCVVAFTAVNSGYTVTATYSPTGTNFTAGTAGTSSAVMVSAATTTVMLSTPTPSPSSVNQSVTFAASVAPAFPNSTTPANVVYYPTGVAVPVGVINFADQTANPAVCSAQLSTGTSASCSSSTLALGMHTVQATFVPSSSTSSFTGSTSSTPVVENVVASPTSLALVSSAANPAVNQSITLTATLTQMYTGNTKPQGTVVYSDQTTSLTLCTVAVTNGSVPTCTAVFTTAGTHTISASYSSDPNFGSSTNTPPLSLVVGSGNSTTTITSSPANPTVNTPVTFTASVVASVSGNGMPSGGSVTFTDITNSAAQVPLCTSVILANSTASCTSTFTTAQTHMIVATYSGDKNFNTSSSGTYMQVIAAGATKLAIVPNITSSQVDQPVVFAITLTGVPSGASSLAGTVTLTDGSTSKPICSTSTVAADGTVPSCTTNFLAPGSHPVTAVYTNSSGNFTNSTSTTSTISVTAATTTVALPAIVPVSGGTQQPNTSSVNQQLNFSSVVTPTYSDTGFTIPTGTIVFSTSTNARICSATIQGDGTANCSAFLGGAGVYAVSASYTSGDANFANGSSTGMTTETISPGATTIMITAPQSSVVATGMGSYTAILTVNSPALSSTGSTAGTVPLAGTFTFTAGGGATVPASCSTTSSSIASGASYSCTITFPITAGGPVSVTANFTSSTGNFASSTATAQQPVQNFAISVNRTPTSPATVYVTQGANNTSDPLFPSTVGGVLAPAASGFGDSVIYSCPSPTAGLTCTATPSSGTVTPVIVVSATASAAPGIYTAILTATDSTTPALSHSVSFTIQVNALVASINLTAGATGSLQVPFPSGLTLSPSTGTNYCPFYIVNGAQLPTSATGVGITCTGPSPQTSNGSIGITIATKSATSAALRLPSSSRISLAAILGVPIFFLAGWRRRKGHLRTNWYRSLGVMSVLLSLSSIIGCGGGFTTTPSAFTATASGTYQLEVVTTDTSGKLYYAIVPLVVNQ